MDHQSQTRAVVRVAAGVLRRSDGAVLLAQRPEGKIAAGRWEFPGGKIETGEAARAALERELHEEIGVRVGAARPLLKLRHAYTERTVELDTWLVEAWDGEPQGLEDQALAWVQPDRIWDYDVLEADGPIVDALRLPLELPITPDIEDPLAVTEAVGLLVDKGYKLIRLRAPRLSDAAYWSIVDQCTAALQHAGAGVLVDRWDDEWVTAQGVAGLQLTSTMLRQARQRLVSAEQWLIASCHDAAQVQQACALGANALVIGPVRHTPTHPGAAALGFQGFAELAALANRPCYALGGMALEDLDAVVTHGGQGVAGISAFR